MWKSLSVVFALWIYAAVLALNQKNQENDDYGVRPIILNPSQGKSKMTGVQLTENLSNSDLVYLVNGIIRSLSQNGTLTKEGTVKLKDMIGHYLHQPTENFTVDEQPADEDTDKNALEIFLRQLKLKDGDFDFSITRSVRNEIDIEEEEEETDDPQAKDRIVVDYIKNIDKTIAVEGEDPEIEPDDKQLKKLFSIMNL